MVRGLFIQSIFILSMAVPVLAQVYLPKNAYMHLVGRIDSDQEITMNLVKVKDSLYADLVFTEKQCNFSVLAGNVLEDGTFTLRYPFCDTGMVFKGHFVTRQSISGTYESFDSVVSHPFVLVESYPEGSIPLVIHSQDSTRMLVEKPESPRVEISLCLIIPDESSNPILTDSLRTRMIASFSGNTGIQKDPEKVIKSVQRTFITDYFSDNESLYETMPDAGSLNWILLKFMHILYNDNNLLTYYLLDYTYTGGAHGMETNNFTVVNIKTGEALTLNDLFKPGYETQLTSLLTSKLKLMAKTGPEEKLSDHGFFVDDISPNSNFYITASGIGFFYNHYEIAPYASGQTDILLTFHDLLPILRNPGPVSKFLKRR